MDKKLNRREMLKLLGGASSGVFNDPLKMAFATMLTGIVAKAYGAETSGDKNPRNYVMFQLKDAPPRWTWEPMSPFDDPATIIGNRNVMTKFIENGSTNFESLEYKTVSINGINMPWLWDCDVPSVSGSRTMSELMDYMLMIKGVNIVNPDHTGAAANQYRPGGIDHTITSLTGNVSNRPIPFIGMQTSQDPYSSKINKAGVNSLSASGNRLESLLKPFNVTASAFEGQLDSVDTVLDQVFANIENFLKRINSSFGTSTSSHKDALTLIKRDFGNLNTEFYGRRDKYRALLKLATSPIPDGINPLTSFEGINTKPIMINGIDIRLTLKTNQSNIHISHMAEQFAVIEYVLQNQLTTSIAVGLQAFNGFGFDEHTIDPVTSTYTNSLWNRGLATCLLELIDQLKAADVWDDTVISLAAEFGRNPKGVGDGSDHAPQATSVTYFSGCLAGNEIVGDTKKESGSTTYPGTWGVMAANETFGFLTHGHLAATVATLLKVESPVTSAPSLVKVENGKLKSKLAPSKLV
jgi:hypothetical protein